MPAPGTVAGYLEEGLEQQYINQRWWEQLEEIGDGLLKVIWEN